MKLKKKDKTCFGCKYLAEKPCGDGYYTTFFCWFGQPPVNGIWELGGAVIGDEESDPKRCKHFAEGPSVVFKKE
jgi:hypothetical protein